MSLWIDGKQVSRFERDAYCKQGEHWIDKNKVGHDAVGSPFCVEHRQKVRWKAHKKSYGDKNEK